MKLKNNPILTVLTCLAFALRLLPVVVIAVIAVAPDATLAADVKQPPAAASEPSIVERGPHHRVWEWAVEVPFGPRTVKQFHRYTELASGMHYPSATAPGQWLESQEAIGIVNGFGVATQGQCHVIFAPNLNTAGAIDLLTPDGRFRSTVLGLAFTDSSGNSVLIGETVDSIGQLIQPNVVLYPNAIIGDGVKCDARYTYQRGSFEQEILIRSQLPSPSDYGMDASARLEIWTEFLESPTPVISTRFLKPVADGQNRNVLDRNFADDTLEFGTMRIGPGTAFALNEVPADPFEETPVLVAKTWTAIDQRQFLVEKVDLADIALQLSKLPKTAAIAPGRSPSGSRPTIQNQPGTVSKSLLAGQAKALTTSGTAQGTRGEVLLSLSKSVAAKRNAALKATTDRASLKEQTRARAAASIPLQAETWTTNRTIQVAQVANSPAVSIDYSIVINQTNFTFQGDSTYFIAGPVNLSGTTVLEGGCVIKNTNGTGSSRIVLQGPMDCRTGAYRPAIFTGKSDNSVGEVISGSSGNPTTNYFGYYLVLNGNTNAIDLHDVHLRYAYYGIYDLTGPTITVSHAQFSGNLAAVGYNNGGVYLRNTLIHDCTYACGGGNDTNWHGENLTCHRLTNLRSAGSMFLTNSLVISITNHVGYTGVNVISNLDDTGIFQTVGFGSHYLADGSPYRNAGTTNINSALADALKNKTTYPPILLTNSITSDTTLSPVVQRDTDTPDIGFEYDPLDYLVSGVTVASNVTVIATNGVAIGVNYSSLDGGGSGWGFTLDSARFISQGSALALNHVASAHTVQEKSAGNPGTRSFFYDNSGNYGAWPSQLSDARFRFTEISEVTEDGYFIYDGDAFSALEWTHGRFYNPSLVVDTSGTATLVCGLTNTLWERGGVQFGLGTTGSNVTVHLRNNLVRNGNWHFVGGTTNWTVRDNLFDNALTLDDHGTPVQNSYNAFYATSVASFSGGTSNLTLTNLTYQTGQLGQFYQTNNSLMFDAGSRNATNSGLYHFTTTTNQTKELTSIINIGLHYVALTNGVPIDTDGDGIPDYQEDVNGNGSVDSGETDWKSAGDLGLRVFITRPRNGGTIP